MNEASEIETSPVPGGRSQSRKSRSPHQTSPRNCWIALCSIGPRQITGVSSGTKWPIEITFTPCASSGRIMSLNPTGLPTAPSIRGTLNPHTSASSTPTERPAFARAAARFTVTLDLPTPPLPEAIAMIEVCGGNEIFVSGAAGCPPRSCETSFSRSSALIGVSSTSTRSTPSSGCDGGGHVARDPVLERTSLDGEEDVDPDDAAVHLDRLQHPDLVDRSADLGVPDALQRLADLRFRGHGLLLSASFCDWPLGV